MFGGLLNLNGILCTRQRRLQYSLLFPVFMRVMCRNIMFDGKSFVLVNKGQQIRAQKFAFFTTKCQSINELFLFIGSTGLLEVFCWCPFEKSIFRGTNMVCPKRLRKSSKRPRKNPVQSQLSITREAGPARTRGKLSETPSWELGMK